ncbi:Sec-independent protein translocase protein TatB [Arcobacteraceae bacterium]|nr:Sec-independent protein translocase protein TatB [Arcobacteraceae bacterium]
MFGMGFMEIFLVLIVAIIALGPEKLPGALVDAAKFFKKMKGELSDAKSSIDKELDLSSMKEDAAQLRASVENIQSMANIDLDDLDPTQETKKEEVKQIEPEPKKKKEKVSMKKSETV